MAQYENKGDRQNILLADELPEDMTGTQDTQHICGKCAWYSFRKLECICGKTGKEVAFFATKKCFTTEKDTTMEEEKNAQPVAETGTQVCKECGRTLPLEEFQRRRYGKRDKVCKACRAEKIRVGMATGKKVKVDIPEKIAKAVSAPSPASEAALKEAVKTEGVEIAQLCRYLTEFKMAGLALWGMMPGKEEDIKEIIAATKWMIPFCKDIFAAAAELKRDGNNVVPAIVARHLGFVGQMFVEDLGNAFYPLAKECDTSEQKPAEWSEEDEYKLKQCIKIVSCWEGDYDIVKSPYSKFLKSLRPQYHGDVTMTEAYKMGLEAGKASHWKPSEEQTARVPDLSDAALLEELRRRGYKGTITKVQEVEI